MGQRPKQQKMGNIAIHGTPEQWEETRKAWHDEKYGPWFWARSLNLKNERGDPLEWKDRKFLIDILCDMHPYQVTVKCTQVGLSTIEVLKTKYLGAVKKMAVIYTMPTRDLLWKFLDTKLVPMQDHNPVLNAVAPMTTSTKELQSYKDGSYVVFHGTMGDNQDISLTADVIIADEADRSDLQVIEGLESRLMASKFAGQWWFTNPTRPNIGTDLKWQQSDQRRWHITCPHCGMVQYLDYWENVDKEKKAYVCRSCHGELSDDVRRNGKWIPTNPGARWHGYHINQLMAPWITAERLIDAEENKDKEFFYNFMLGLPVIGEGVSVDRTVILGNRVPDDDPRRNLKSTKKFMGVDVGSVLHVVISDEHGVRKLATLADERGITPQERADMKSLKSKWGKLRQLFLMEQIDTCVIDNLPSEKQADFQRAFPYKVWRCIYDYKDKRKADILVDRKEGVVHVHRTRIIDTLVDEYSTNSRPLFLKDDDPLLNGTGNKKTENCLGAHWESFYVVGADGQDVNVVKKDKVGNVVRTWENAGPDHFGHADIYNKVAQVIGGTRGSGESFMLGDAKVLSKKKDDDDEEDAPWNKADEASFYNM